MTTNVITLFTKLQTVVIAAFVAVVLVASPAFAVVNDVVISEVMPDPVTISDADGEWIELENKTASDIDITGWELDDGGTPFVFPATTIITGNGFLVVCADENLADANCDVEWTGMNLSNLTGSATTETVTLTDTSPAVVDSFVYEASDVTPGASIEDATPEDPTPTLSNNVTDTYPSGDTGTPSAQNRSTYPVRNATDDITFSDLQSALDAPTTADGETIELLEDVTISQQVTIVNPVVIDGNGFKVSPTFTKTNNDNNAVFGVTGTTDVTIKDLTIDGSGGTDLHGFNVYESTAVVLSTLTITDNNAAVIVNSSMVSINDITTSGNAWYSINVDQKTSMPASLDISGTNSQSEATDIFVDDNTKDVIVNDVDGQYLREDFGAISVYNRATIPACDTTLSSFDTFARGSVNSQNGWSATNTNLDQEIVNNVYGFTDFGCKSLRFSNSYVTGSFGDQLFSSSVGNEAGETSAVNDGLSGGTRVDQFEAEWSFASTTPNVYQPDLQITASPDRGDGARMSWINMSDKSDGLAIGFYDYQTGVTPDEFVFTEVASGLDRTQTHTVKVHMTFVDGVANDVVKIYVNGSLVHTGTSWEDYFRERESVPTRTVDSLLFRSAGTSAPASAGKGLLIDNVSINTMQTDSDAPVISDVTIANPESGSATVEFTATDASGISLAAGDTHVRFFNGTNLIGSAQVASANTAVTSLGGDRYQAIIDTKTFAPNGSEGTYWIYVRAEDNLGNAVGNNSTRGIVVDNRAPQASNIRVDNPVNEIAEIRFNLEETNGVNLAPGKTHVRFYQGSDLVNGAANQSANTAVTFDAISGDYVAQIDTETFADDGSGSYWVYIRAEDNLGNAVGNNDIREVIVDNVDPTITVKSDFIGDESAKVFSKVSFQLFDEYQVDKYILNGQEVDFGNNKWSDANFQNIESKLIEGLNTFVLFDVAGNTTTYKFTYDSTAPDAMNVSPGDGTVINGASVTQEWSSSATDVDYYVYESYNDAAGTSLRWTEDISATNKTATNVSEAIYWWRVKAIDVAGNESPWTDLWKITVDNTAPVATISNPSDGDVISGTVNITGLVTDDNPMNSFFRITGPSSYNQTSLYTDGRTTHEYTWDTSSLDDGSYVITFETRDLAQNKDAGSVTSIDVEVDNTAPVAVFLGLTTEDTSPALSGTIDDDTATVEVTVDGNTYSAVVASGVWSIAQGVITPALEVGDYEVIIESTDQAGNVNSQASPNLLVIEAITTTPPTDGDDEDDDENGDEDTNNGDDEDGEVAGDNNENNNGGIGGDPFVPEATAVAAATTEGASEESGDESDEARVLQSTTDGEIDTAEDSEADQCFEIFGICWYWYIIPGVGVVVGYLYYRSRQEVEKE